MTSTDEHYRGIVTMSNANLEHFVVTLMKKDSIHISELWKHDTWLHLLGLIETWDMVANRHD